MTENEFLLEDRLTKIRSVVGKYGEQNFYISYSGGKDSTVLSALVDMALPNNQIPRVFADTGIELNMIHDFVKAQSERDRRIVIIKPSVPIKRMLEEYGYPFKSKDHSKKLGTYQRNGMTRTAIRYLDGTRGRYTCPNILRYQFTEEFKLKVDYQCCVQMKEKPLIRYGKENSKPYAITGIRADEGGVRTNSKCLVFSGGKLNQFHPLSVVSQEWEDWFIGEYNIEICDIYKPPYSFERTGCKGCPFNIYIQKELDVLNKFFPNEAKQCEAIWEPVYSEYRRIGYRLKKPVSQMTIIAMNGNRKNE